MREWLAGLFFLRGLVLCGRKREFWRGDFGNFGNFGNHQNLGFKFLILCKMILVYLCFD